MFHNVLEISSRAKKNGRVPIKIALLKIHEDDNEVNKNGIHWKREYVENAMDTAISMPICAEFLTDDKDIPFGHGLTGVIVDENGVKEPVFENSETVGVIESVSIETVNDGENDIEVLCGTGVLFSQRYPNFVKWVRNNYQNDVKIDTSIEISGLEENANKIVYDGEPKKEYRIPSVFCFTGTAILSIEPSDNNAIVLEISQKNNKEAKVKMDFNMDEVKKVIADTINELNNKEVLLTNEVADLNAQLKAKDAVIAEKVSELNSKEENIAELNENIEKIKQALQEMESERQTWWTERDALEKQLGELRAEKRLAELNSATANFSDEEKKFAESEINSFKENPLEGDVEAICNKIYAGIGQAAKEEAERIAEINAKNTNTSADIFSDVSFVNTNTGVNVDDENIF